MEANRLREGCSGSEGDFGGEGRRSWAAGVAVPVVFDNIWYAVFLRAPRALVPPLGDVLALPLYARTMGSKDGISKERAMDGGHEDFEVRIRMIWDS